MDNEHIMKIMGERLSHLIKSTSGMTGIKLAEMLTSNKSEKEEGISPSNISMWRKGKRPIPPLHAHRIAQIFNVSVSYVMGEEKNDEWQNMGKKIEAVRKAKEISYMDLAKKTGIKPIDLSQIEQGMRPPTSEEYQSIANVLDLSLEQLTIDYNHHMNQVRKHCEAMGLTPDTLKAIIDTIKFDIFS